MDRSEPAFAYASLGGDVGTAEVALVAQQDIAYTVARVEKRCRQLGARIQIAPEVQIQLAVIVVIGGGGDRDQMAPQPGLLTHVRVPAVVIAIHAVQVRGPAKKEIFITVIIEVGEQGDVDA